MQLDTCHFGIHVHSLEDAHDFYVNKFGLEVLQFNRELNLLALRAGSVRISIFADALADEVSDAAKFGGQIIFRTEDILAAAEALKRKGLNPPEIVEAPGFMKYIEVEDPSGNPVVIAQYLRSPLCGLSPSSWAKFRVCDAM